MLKEYYENDQADDKNETINEKKEINKDEIIDDEEKSWKIDSEIDSDDKNFEEEIGSEDKKEEEEDNKKNKNEDKINNISFGDEIIYKNNKINELS